jgi:hypothetical protein
MTTLVLTTADRCDRCGARAYVLVGVSVPEGGNHELLFCAHHYRQHENQLLFSGARVLLDQRRGLQNTCPVNIPAMGPHMGRA